MTKASNDQDPAAVAIALLNERVFLVDLRDRRVHWASPALGDPRGSDMLAQWPSLCERLLGEAGPRPGEHMADAFLDPMGRPIKVRAARGAGPLAWRLAVKLEPKPERFEDEQRRLAERESLLLASRSLSVGEMASTIAHELNQPMGAIINLLEGLRLRTARWGWTEEAGKAVDRAIDQAQFASSIIARVRRFVEQREPVFETLNLGALAQRTLELLDWDLARKSIRVGIEIDPQAAPVRGDAVLVQQVLVNLIRNGIEAISGAGGDARSLAIEVAPAADGAMTDLRVQDSGPGLSAEAAENAFCAFFTTKPAGMGLGLSLCRSIVEMHGGKLWWTRSDQGGAVFHVRLPAHPPGDGP